MITTIIEHSINQPQYVTLCVFSTDDDGYALADALKQNPGHLVGDWSYDPLTDNGTASIIIECTDRSTRMSNATLVPAYLRDRTQQWNNHYRCELFGILLGLYCVLHLEQKYGWLQS